MLVLNAGALIAVERDKRAVIALIKCERLTGLLVRATGVHADVVDV